MTRLKYRCAICRKDSSTFVCPDCRNQLASKSREIICDACKKYKKDSCGDCIHTKCINCGENVDYINHLFCKSCFSTLPLVYNNKEKEWKYGVSNCRICNKESTTHYALCEKHLSEYEDKKVLKCEECDSFFLKGFSCICKTAFIQCQDCGCWHDNKHTCFCKTNNEGNINKKYEKKKPLTEAELILKRKLNQVIDLNKYELHEQVALRSIVKTTERTNEIHRYIDFCIIDKNSTDVIVCIEYDDSSHNRPDRKERDTVVENILQEAGHKLIRIKRDDNMTIDFLRGRLHEYL